MYTALKAIELTQTVGTVIMFIFLFCMGVYAVMTKED